LSCPYTPEQNGLTERKHRHIVELDLANMMHAFIPLKYWDYIFESMVFVINRLPSALTGTISPFEILFKQKSAYIMLHILGCSCYSWLRPYNHHKLLLRSENQTRSLKLKKFPDHHLYIVSTSDNYLEPTCFTQASKDPVWRQAMANELIALAQNTTWDLVAPPPDAHVIGAK
jgi:hypothetical protein